MAVEWFWDWVGRHIDRIPRLDWPDVDSEYWAIQRDIFERLRITLETADKASRLMAENPPNHLDGMIPALKEKLRTLSAAARPALSDASNEDFDRRAEAKWARLSEAKKAEIRRVVDERRPFFSEAWRLAVAKAVALDPSLTPAPPQPGETHPRHPFGSRAGMRKPLGPLPKFLPYAPDGDLKSGETQEAE